MHSSKPMRSGAYRIRVIKSLDSQRTHFEVKYLARGETCWQLNMRKPDGYQTRFDNWQASNKA